ncbi:MAG: hypothetical protein WKG07_11865 [Hymenobacter sp.]
MDAGLRRPGGPRLAALDRALSANLAATAGTLLRAAGFAGRHRPGEPHAGGAQRPAGRVRRRPVQRAADVRAICGLRGGVSGALAAASCGLCRRRASWPSMP